ncbi:hypothetical protein L2E82_48489 [Cichorium intybus]|uniref:Uncharacterized protein n=1 Tax=Cichorium intybus TaxID=13427 RepID=A0ACB8YYI7_CICIN|nr:hypothetical protein L2E82_48489 [Cichorium intybus]
MVLTKFSSTRVTKLEMKKPFTWGLVKGVHPGDRVIALHVLTNNEIVDRDGKSGLLSLLKTFDSILAVYQGFCNLKQALRHVVDARRDLGMPDGVLINGKGKTYRIRVSNVGVSTSLNFRCYARAPAWEESLAASVEKFEFAGASPTDLAMIIKNHCSNGAASKGLGFKIDEIVQAWNEMYDVKR